MPGIHLEEGMEHEGIQQEEDNQLADIHQAEDSLQVDIHQEEDTDMPHKDVGNVQQRIQLDEKITLCPENHLSCLP